MKYINCPAFGKLISRAFIVMAVSVEALGTVEFVTRTIIYVTVVSPNF